MLILQNILSQEIVQRLGWTLLHFIWQAAAIALILTILLRVLRKATANLRYIIDCLSLALIVLIPVITIKMVPVSQPLTAAHFAPATVPTMLLMEEMPAPETTVIAKPYLPESVNLVTAIPFKQRVTNTLEPVLPYIVSGWLIGVFGLSIWHLGGWTQLQRLKRRLVKQVDPLLRNRLKLLIQKLKVKQTVQLMESALVQIPTVVGWIKPVILLPTSAITGLSTEQLEAIIAHELAHIKRFDYLINILQTVVEILGFYHPAVWWVSHKIRAERENCCDDLAVSISGDRLSYAGALASMEEIRAAGGKLAVAATGGNLFRRICRLLGKDSIENTGLSWIPAATAILLIIALAIPTTLALTNKTDSLLTETKTDVHVEDDITITPAPDEESSAANSKQTADTQIKDERVLSADMLKKLGLAVAMYASDNNKQLPDTLEQLKLYIANEQDYFWLHDNVEYVLKETKYKPSQPNIPVAYDKTQKEKQSGANVLFLDGHVEFLTPKRLSELDIKRAEILIEAWFLAVNKDFIENINHNADSPDEAKELLKLKSQLLAAVEGSNQVSLILSERDINLFLKAVQAHKDSKIIAHPQIICQEGKSAKITTAQKIPILKGYTEPNSPSEKPQPIFEKVEEGITLSLKPKLTPNKNIEMQFESVISRFLDSEERKFEGKAPYKPPKIQKRTQGTRYWAKDGQILLFGGNKITDRQDGQTEQKDLLVLIKASTIGPSNNDKLVEAKDLIVTEEPPTSKVISPPPVAKSSIERPKDNKQEKTKTYETITEIFEIRHGDPAEIVEVLKKLINGRPDTASVIESSNGPILLIPEPKRKWIIAKASPENINQIGQWIKKLDTEQTIGMDPIDATVYEQLETIVDLSDLAPQMSFAEVIEILENSVEPPLQIQPIWKDLLDNAEVEQATPAAMDPLPHIKLRKALEILLTSVSSTGLPKPTYVVDEGVILIGTPDVLPQKKAHRIYETSDLVGTDTEKASPENMPKIAKQTKELDVPLDVVKVKPRIIELQNSDAEKMVEILNTLFTKEGEGALNIRDILFDRGIKVKQKIAGPLYKQLTFEVVPGTNKLIVISKIPEVYDVIEEFISDLDRQDVSPENIKQIVQSLTTLNRKETPLPSLEQIEIDPQAIKSQEMQIIRQQYINNNPQVKALSDQITEYEVKLIELRQKLTPSHPQLQHNASLLRAMKNRLLWRKKEVGKAFDELMKKETDKSNKETFTTLLDELQEPNLPMDPNVLLISNTFIDCPLIEALQSIAATGNVTIIPDESIEGVVSCTLRDVTVETALDIILAGTPYVWKKTPHYYLVASRLERTKMVHRVYDISNLVYQPANYRMSGSRSMKMGGKGGGMMGGGMPPLMPPPMMGGMIDDQGSYMQAQKLVQLIQETIEPDSWDGLSDSGEGTIMAYPMQSPRKLAVMQTNKVHQEIEKLLNAKRESLENQASISIEGVFLSVSDDFLKDVGLDTNPEKFSDAWNEHLAATYPASPNGQTYGLILDDLQVRFLLKAVQAHKDSKALVAPRVHTRVSTTAVMGITEEYRFIKSYNEPNSPSKEPQPKRDKEIIGTHIWITPKLTDDNKNVNLDLKLEMRQIKGIIEGKYKEKYPYYKPVIDVISAKMSCTIPEGKTMLIGGLKIIEPIIKEPGAPGLKDLPLIGAAFSDKDNSREQKMLLILVKPVINPQQKVTNVLPGQKDSEEEIQRLAEQLDKKINQSDKPK